jgi:hypothetical protein
VRLQATADAHPGALLEIVIEVVCLAQTSFDAIELRFCGHERIHGLDPLDHDGDGRTLFELDRKLLGPAALSTGEHRFRAAFFIPADAPPTYHGAHVTVYYDLEVRLALPWASDPVMTFPVVVLHKGGPRADPAPLRGRSRDDEAPAIVEIALADRVYAPNDLVKGAFAIQRTATSRPTGPCRIQSAIIAVERAGVNGNGVTERYRSSETHVMGDCQEGRAIPLALQIPVNAPPSCSSPRWGLSWFVECTVESGWGVGATHRLPILVVPIEGLPRVGLNRPPVGRERARDGLQLAGAAYGLRLEPSTIRLSGRVGTCEVSVEPVVGGDHGALMAEIKYSDLGLGLSIEVRRDDSRGAAAASVVRVRDLEQFRRAGGGPLGKALLQFDRAEMQDDRAVLHGSAKIAGDGWDARLFLAAVVDLAGQIGITAACIPPPRPMERVVPAWRTLAHALGTQLTVGSMSIRGGLWRDARVDVRTRFDQNGQPNRTEVTMVLGVPIGRTIEAADIDTLPLDVREVGEALRAQTQSLRIGPDAVRFDLPAPLVEPMGIGGLLDEAAAIVARLGGDRRLGPYR